MNTKTGTTTGKVNRYPGTCPYCHGYVAKSAGVLVERGVKGRKGGRWAPAHIACASGQTPQVSVIRTSGGTFTRNVKGRCIDAPCCGCCTI